MKIFAWIILFLIGIIIFSTTCNWFSDGAKTLNKEFNPSTLLKKYEYFKNLSAAIDKNRADIEMYQEMLEGNQENSIETSQLKAELRGIISIHNGLCAEYNSAMVKFNYNFTNKGSLPQSNLTPLPREYKPYITSLKQKQ